MGDKKIDPETRERGKQLEKLRKRFMQLVEKGVVVQVTPEQRQEFSQLPEWEAIERRLGKPDHHLYESEI